MAYGLKACSCHPLISQQNYLSGLDIISTSSYSGTRNISRAQNYPDPTFGRSSRSEEEPTITWSIDGKACAYDNGTKRCDLCLMKKRSCSLLTATKGHCSSKNRNLYLNAATRTSLISQISPRILHKYFYHIGSTLLTSPSMTDLIIFSLSLPLTG